MKFVLLLALLVAMSTCQTPQLRFYTQYANCFLRWDKEKVGKSQNSICTTPTNPQGSLVTALAMILQYHTTEIDRSAANPKTLNEWLQKNGGYDDKSNVNFGVIRNLKTIKYTETITNVGRLKELFSQGHDIILNLNQSKNYGVLLGWIENDVSTLTDDVYIIHDPSNPKNNKCSLPDITLGLVFEKLSK